MDKAIILPTVLIIINIGASMPYYMQGDWRMGGYWISAACITFFVTY